jgi:transposase-like protein
MRIATTAVVTDKPTVSETSLADRQEIIRLTEAGWTAAAIADHLGRSARTVRRWRSAHRHGGAAALAYHSRQPHTRAEHAMPQAVIDRIVAIRSAHLGWGACLIQRQLRLDGVSPLPCRRTVQHWLGRLGYASVRPVAHTPLGFPQPRPSRDDTLWEVDHKQKGGGPT